MKSNEAIIVITTTEKEEEAEFLARTLLQSRLAACVQIEAIRSLYRWKGAIETSGEYRLQIKTLRCLYSRIETTIRQYHSYKLPEILALPAVEISPDYRRWIESSVAIDSA
ncbi:divalent-cation tolerance protein CutA [Nitratifractor sp.]